jgi:hydrogenase expression/formation protein HypD
MVEKKPALANQYVRAVKHNGNLKAKGIISKVFKVSDADWRGLGKIPQSGLKIKDGYSQFDAQNLFSIKRANEQTSKRATQCKCGDVLKGLISPLECPLFLKICHPDNPLGPCMVSSEGACNAYYKYH